MVGSLSLQSLSHRPKPLLGPQPIIVCSPLTPCPSPSASVQYVLMGRFSSINPLQLLSLPSQISGALGLIFGSLSLQSVLFAEKYWGKLQFIVYPDAAEPKPSWS